MIELPVRKDMLCFLPDRIVVLLGPAFLETDNVWRWTGSGDLDADFCQALVAKLGYKLETPAIK
jgi:hypothetical protein